MRDDAWRLMHERFARDWEESLSPLLRMEVQVRVVEYCEQTSAQFLDELEKPTCLYRLRGETCGDAYVDMNPAVLHPMLDRLLGGGLVAEPIPRRSLTDLEVQLSRRVMTRLVGSLETTLGAGLGDRMTFEKLNDDPMGTRGGKSSLPVHVVRLRITLGGIDGLISFAWPRALMEQWRGSALLHAAGDSASPLRGSGAGSVERSRGSAGTRVELRVGLSETKIRRHEALDLNVGDIITTDHAIDDPLEVRVGGVPRFWASPGILGDRTAFRVLGPMTQETAEGAPDET